MPSASQFEPFIPPHRVLDHFTLLDEAEAVRGRVNVNTPIDNILASAYYDMPLREHAGGNARLRLRAPSNPANPNSPEGNVSQIEQVFRDWRDVDGQEPRYFRHLSDLGRVFEGDTGETLDNYLRDRILQTSASVHDRINDFDREAIIRNAAGLFSTRHQLFLVILRADAFAPAFGMTGIEQGSVLATGHAVALLWRDARPDPDDPEDEDDPDHIRIHPILIRHFQPVDP